MGKKRRSRSSKVARQSVVDQISDEDHWSDISWDEGVQRMEGTNLSSREFPTLMKSVSLPQTCISGGSISTMTTTQTVTCNSGRIPAHRMTYGVRTRNMGVTSTMTTVTSSTTTSFGSQYRMPSTTAPGSLDCSAGIRPQYREGSYGEHVDIRRPNSVPACLIGESMFTPRSSNYWMNTSMTEKTPRSLATTHQVITPSTRPTIIHGMPEPVETTTYQRQYSSTSQRPVTGSQSSTRNIITNNISHHDAFYMANQNTVTGHQPASTTLSTASQIVQPQYAASGAAVGAASGHAVDMQTKITEFIRLMQDALANLAPNQPAMTNTCNENTSNSMHVQQPDDDLDDHVSVSDSETSSRLMDPVSERKGNNLKIPPFDGKESWKIWRNRFEEIAERRRWTEPFKLDALLQRMQGAAGEFVFGELPKSTRQKYSKLIEEMNSRFLVVETRRSYIAKFNNRNQKGGETIEEFAADLKKLYAKAYPGRDSETRNEDLVRKFLDGLASEEAQFHVEFTKNPENLDEAISEVVNFTETHQKRNKGDKRPMRSVQQSSPEHHANPTNKKNTNQQNNSQKDGNLAHKVQELSKQMEQLQQSLQRQAPHGILPPPPPPPAPIFPGPRMQPFPPVVGPRPPVQKDECYYCHGKGHFARNCPQKNKSGGPAGPSNHPGHLNG